MRNKLLISAGPGAALAWINNQPELVMTVLQRQEK
jgi:hypothetical protein